MRDDGAIFWGKEPWFDSSGDHGPDIRPIRYLCVGQGLQGKGPKYQFAPTALYDNYSTHVLACLKLRVSYLNRTCAVGRFPQHSIIFYAP